ncbi:MAG: haloacid dehalogenase type II [Candidatus Puniceispirillales bacterium]
MPLVYDVYGTLLDVDAATRQAVREPGMEALAEQAERLSMLWRQRQLAHSWLNTLMQRYQPFWEITCTTLDMTLDELGISDAGIRQWLLDLYLDLAAYDEVAGELAAMAAAGHKLAVLSNGNPGMLDRALGHAGITALFDAVLSVDEIAEYKPRPAVYALVTARFDCDPADVVFFSSNPWDIAGAGHFGFRTIWINRARRHWDAPQPGPWKETTSLAEAHSLLKA